MDCIFCNGSITDQPSCTLLCGHVGHTRCVLISGLTYNFERFTCITCNTRIISDELVLEIFPDTNISTEISKITEKQEFNESCTNLLKIYKKYNKDIRSLTKEITPILKEYKKYIKPQLTILKSYIKSKKELIKKLDVYKTVRKSQNSFTRAINSIVRKYNINRYELNRYLATLGNYKYGTLFRYNIQRKLNRNFYIRIR